MTNAPAEQPPPLNQPITAVMLSFALAVFLADAALSFGDDLLSLLGIPWLNAVRALVSLVTLMMGVALYALIGFMPAIPKRVFLPVALLGPAVVLVALPLSIYFYAELPVIALLLSTLQVGIGMWIVRVTQGGFRLRWPLIRFEHLNPRRFRWRHLIGFVGVNLGLLLPGAALYVAYCAHLAVAHFTDDFLELRPDGINSIARTYVRDDGKSVHLIPMMHIGDSAFYTRLSQDFPSNSVILLEGVTDAKGHFKNKLSYRRAAESLGLEEQQENFAPARGDARPADVDVDQFAPSTLEILNLYTTIYAKGLSLPLFLDLVAKSQDPNAAKQLWRDILTLRNEHLLRQIEGALLETATVAVPWGAAHMPGLAEEIQRAGFKLSDRQEYQIANFRKMWERLRSGGQ